MGNSHQSKLPDTKLATDQQGSENKKAILSAPHQQISDKVFSLSKEQRKALWKNIGGIDGAHRLSFHFYRRIYENDDNSKQKNAQIRKFCSLFTNRPFAQAVDRVSRFMSSELDGEVTFWNIEWIDNVHCAHVHANFIVSPLAAQTWYSFLCAALVDLDWTETVKQDIRTFFKEVLVFLMMDTWTDCSKKLVAKPMKGLINDGKDRIAFWQHKYQHDKADFNRH